MDTVSASFRAASSLLFLVGFCKLLRMYGWFLSLVSSVSGGEFEGVGEEWLPWLLSTSFRASHHCLGG